jgi:endoglucanase
MKSSFSTFASLAILSVLSTPVLAQVVEWGQCGGIGWTGGTTCVAGTTCVYSSAYYSQCLPGTASATTTTTPTGGSGTPTTTSPSPSSSLCSSTRTKFKFFGVNESGAEWGTAIPGVLGTDYTWPSPSSIDYFTGLGFNAFRVPFMIERLNPPSTGLTGPFNQAYLSGLQTIVSYITGKGAYVLIDPHNYMRYNGAIITSTSTFQQWWQNLATEFKSNANVIFDVMNEPYDIAAESVFELNQAAINGIRASGATTQLIVVEGTSWTGAWTWTSAGNAAVFGAIQDPYNNVAIEMHQYLDSDGSGTSATCVNSTIGVSRLADATAWLQSTGLKGFLGEMGTGSNSVCIEAIQGALCAMQESDVWIGMTWWAAGPWWGTSPTTAFYSIEPPSGLAIPSILPQALEPFL